MAESIALGIAGVVSPFITQWVKNSFGWKKWAAIFLAALVAYVCSLIAVVLADGELNWQKVGAAFAISQVVYAGFFK